MRPRSRLRHAASVAAALLVLACAGPAKQNVILVGEYGSFTGTTATLGQATHNGIVLAIDEVNAAGGIGGRKLRLISEDDQSKPEEAATAVSKLIHQDRVSALLGEGMSSRSLAAAPIAQAQKVPMISPASTNPKVTQVGDYIFRVCFIDPFQGSVMAKFAASTLKVKRVAILYDVRNEYSVGLRQYFINSFNGLGGQIAAEQSFSEGDSDFRAQLTQLKASRPEAIFVPSYYGEASTIARQARELGINVPLLGGDGWDSPKLFEIGGKAIEGSYLTNHYSIEDPSPATRKFVKDFKGKYGASPDIPAALGYDAAKVLADALRRAGSTDGPKLRDAIAATVDFPGVTGKITIDKDRNVVKPAVVLKVVDGKFQYVETVSP
jgi:branched-chain amino acid transport system substrate-binding protein